MDRHHSDAPRQPWPGLRGGCLASQPAGVDRFDLGIEAPPSPCSETVPTQDAVGLGDGDKEPPFHWSFFSHQAAILLVTKQRDGQVREEMGIRHGGGLDLGLSKHSPATDWLYDLGLCF